MWGAFCAHRRCVANAGGRLALLSREEPIMAKEVAGGPVFGTVDSLILDLLEWIGPDARPYAETLDAWRTSCPALPVWEEANDRGFVSRRHASGRQGLVSVSAAGSEYLREHGRPLRH